MEGNWNYLYGHFGSLLSHKFSLFILLSDVLSAANERDIFQMPHDLAMDGGMGSRSQSQAIEIDLYMILII